MRVFILDGTAAVGELGDAFETLEWTSWLWKPDSVILEMNLRQLHASAVEKGRILYLPDEDGAAFLIESIETIDEPGRQQDDMRIIGRAIDAIATEERLALPASGQAYDKQTSVPAETAIKHYVDENAGPSAAANRQVPDLTIATDAAGGATVSTAARYQLVGDILREIGQAAGVGWRTVFDPSGPAFEFDTIIGTDRTASVFFDTAFDTLESYRELDSLIDTKTHAVVAGQGEGADREVIDHYLGTEKTGLDRREVFIDARDVEPGDSDVLQQRGEALLTALLAQASYEASVHPYGSFRYRTDWDVGDLVTLRDADRSLAAEVRVVGVTSRIMDTQTAPERVVHLDRPYPTLQDRVSGSPVTGGAVDKPVLSTAAATGDHADLVNVTADQHHARSHDHSAAGDGTALAPASIGGMSTWTSYTPTITGAGTAAFSINSASYQKIGKMVMFSIELNISSAGSGGGAIAISLPSTAGVRNQVCIGFAQGFTTFLSGAVFGLINSGSSDVVPRDQTNVALNRSHFAASAVIRLSGWYMEA